MTDASSSQEPPGSEFPPAPAIPAGVDAPPAFETPPALQSRPEVGVAGAFAGGLVLALILKRIAR